MTSRRARPNLLVLMADQHAPRFTGAYGHPFVRTPELDRLASRGVLFENAYCNSPVCAPSRASFLTGRLPHSIGMWTNSQPFASDLPTWAHYLSAAGYQTALAGKQHFTGPDQKHGFEHRFGTEIHSERIRPYSLVTYTDASDLARFYKYGVGRTAYTDHDDQVVADSVRFLAGGRDRGRPFALCASLFAPHHPFIVEQKYWEMYWPEHGDLPPALPTGYLDRQHPAWRDQRFFYRMEVVTDDVARHMRAAYYALTTFLDEQIGRILEALERSGEADNTVVVYTTDHGEHLGEHGLWFKKTFFDESAKVPLIVSWPREYPGGQRRAQVVSLVDIARTLLDWGETREPYRSDGASLDGILRDAQAPWENVAIGDFIGVDEMVMATDHPSAGRPRRMIRAGRYKLNYFYENAPELYDLEADPGEWHDLAADPAHRDVVHDLSARLARGWDGAEVTRLARESVERCQVIMEAESVYLGAAPMAMGLADDNPATTPANS